MLCFFHRHVLEGEPGPRRHRTRIEARSMSLPRAESGSRAPCGAPDVESGKDALSAQPLAIVSLRGKHASLNVDPIVGEHLQPIHTELIERGDIPFLRAWSCFINNQ